MRSRSERWEVGRTSWRWRSCCARTPTFRRSSTRRVLPTARPSVTPRRAGRRRALKRELLPAAALVTVNALRSRDARRWARRDDTGRAAQRRRWSSEAHASGEGGASARRRRRRRSRHRRDGDRDRGAASERSPVHGAGCTLASLIAGQLAVTPRSSIVGTPCDGRSVCTTRRSRARSTSAARRGTRLLDLVSRGESSELPGSSDTLARDAAPLARAVSARSSSRPSARSPAALRRPPSGRGSSG